MKEVMLYTGGMDSYMAWRLLDKPPILYVDMGHAYAEREIENLKVLHPDLYVPSDDRLFLGDLETASGWIPLRNAFLLMVGAVYRDDISTVYLNALKGEGSNDKAPRFLRQMTDMMSFCLERKVKAVAPFGKLHKYQLVRLFLERFPAPSDLQALCATSVCYRAALPSGMTGCGACGSCFFRWVAMSLNNVEETYMAPPWEWEMAQSTHWRDWVSWFLKRPLSYWIPGLMSRYYVWRALRTKGGWR